MSRPQSRYGHNKTNDSTRSFFSHLHATADTHKLSIAQTVIETPQLVRAVVDAPKPLVQFKLPARAVKPKSTAAEVARRSLPPYHRLDHSKHNRKRQAEKPHLERDLPRKRIRSLEGIIDAKNHSSTHGGTRIVRRIEHDQRIRVHSGQGPFIGGVTTDTNVRTESPARVRAYDVTSLDSTQPSDDHLPSPPLTSHNKSTSPDPEADPYTQFDRSISLRSHIRNFVGEGEEEMGPPVDEPSILSLPDCVLLEILYSVPSPARKDIFRPRLKNGMHRHGVFSVSPCLSSDDLIESDNIDLAFLRVNKRFYRLGVVAVYHMHQFVLSDPYPAEHWLRTIGPRNISLLQSLALQIYTDWQVSRMQDRTKSNDLDWSPPFDKCKEESWLKIITKYIQPSHNLQTLIVKLFNWGPVESTYSGGRPCNTFHDEFDRATIINSRMRLLQFLATEVRGIPHTHIDDTEGLWLNASTAQQLMERMQQPREGPRQPFREHKPITLSQALARGRACVVRENTRLAEAEEERRWRARQLHDMDCSTGFN